MSKTMTKKEMELSDRLDEIYDRHNAIMKGMAKLNKEWFALRKGQGKILKRLGRWRSLSGPSVRPMGQEERVFYQTANGQGLCDGPRPLGDPYAHPHL